MDIAAIITSRITDEVLSNNGKGYFRAPLVGFSSAFDPAYTALKTIIGEHHLLPTDILPEARSVVSFFVPFSERVVKSNRGEAVSVEWADSYVDCNTLINATTAKIVAMLQDFGIRAATEPSTHTFDTTTLKAPWAHKSAAVISGLGTFGRHRQVITEKGGAGRCGTLLIAADIAPTPKQENNRCRHYAGKSCSYCTVKCPVNALADDAFDRHKCYEQLMRNDALYPEYPLSDVCGKCSVGPCAYQE